MRCPKVFQAVPPPARRSLAHALGLCLLVATFACRPDPAGRAVPGMDLAGVELSELERRGRTVFLRERCASCHIVGAPPPAQFRGSTRVTGRRIGPTLADVGGRYTDAWHHAFLENPRRLIVTSTMPAYPWLVGPDGEPTDDAHALVAWLQRQRDPDRVRDPEAVMAASRDAPVDAAAAESVYRRNCAGCHGADGVPREEIMAIFTPPPADLTADRYALVPRDGEGRLDRERLLGLVVRGVGGTDMPGHEMLAPGDLSSVVDYVRGLAGEGAPEAPPPALDAAHDEAAGQLGAGLWLALGCDGCHGPKGRGDGPLAPETIFDLTEGELKGGLDEAHLAWVTWRGLPGTPMPAFGPALEGLDASMVTARLEGLPEDAESARAALEALGDRLPELDAGARLRALTGHVMEITGASPPMR